MTVAVVESCGVKSAECEISVRTAWVNETGQMRKVVLFSDASETAGPHCHFTQAPAQVSTCARMFLRLTSRESAVSSGHSDQDNYPLNVEST